MEKMPGVSAIIAAHNEELHLANCINSLLSQSYKKLEIIIVENGESKDKTLEIAREYEKKHKNVHAFTIPGKQRGPGNAWNYGAENAKGEILIICGADLIYGKDYVKEGIKPIVDGKTMALVHKEEKCNNLHNLWARAFFKIRPSFDETGMSRVFTIARRDYVLKNPFDSGFGYADDQTIFKKKGTKFQTADLEVYHTNPASFEDTWDHSRWVGRSLENPWASILIFPLFPLWAIYKTIRHLKEDFYIPFIIFLPVYYSIRYFAYFIESLKKVFMHKSS